MHCVGAAKESMKKDNEDWWWTRWMRCCVQCRDAQSKVWMHDLCITRICISLQLSASHIVSQCISLHHSSSHYNSVHLLHPILVHPPPLHQAGTSSSGSLGRVHWVQESWGRWGGVCSLHTGSFWWKWRVCFYKYRGVKRIWLNTRPFKFQTGWV